MNLPQFSVRYPITIAMMMMAIVILGVISFNKLGTDLLPDIYNPRIVVELRSGERSPQDMEQRFSRRLEGSLGTIRNVVEISSVCRVGVVIVTATFRWGTDMDFALLDVQKKISSYESDPDVSSVTVARYDPQEEPIAIYALTAGTSSRDADELRRIGENVVRRNLERLDGVARVNVYGGIKREVRVELDAYLLDAYGLTVGDVITKIRAANVDASGGKLVEQDKAYIIKGIGRYGAIEEVRETVVGYKEPTNGSADSSSIGIQQEANTYSAQKVPVYLSDIGAISYAPEERTDAVFFNGEESVGLYVFKESKDNTVRVADLVAEQIERMQGELGDVGFSLVYSQANFIKSAIGEVESTAVIGIFLAVLVLYAFLRHFGATIMVSLAIPVSVLATFSLMFFQGLSLNIMTLGGLALGAGMLVDNAIVVIENTFRRRQLGDDAETAAVKGASDVAVAIVAATLTTIIVFLPIVYVRGVAAELFKEQAWVVAFSLLSSLFVAFLLVPALAAKLFVRSAPRLKGRHFRIPFYETLLAWALNHRVWIILSTTALLGISVILVPIVGSEFVPRSVENQVKVQVEMPPGTPIEATSRVLKRMEVQIKSILGDGVEHIYSTVNVQGSQNVLFGGTERNEHKAEVALELARGRNMTPVAAMNDLERNLDLSGVELTLSIRETSLQQTIGTSKAPVAIELSGTDLQVLQETGDRLVSVIASIEGIQNVTSSMQQGLPELSLEVDRTTAASFGLDGQQIAELVRQRLSGEVATDFYAEGNDRSVRVVFSSMSAAELRNMSLDTPSGAVVRLGDISDLVPQEGPKEILRKNQNRVVHISAGLEEGVKLSEAVGSISNALEAFPLAAGYRMNFTGEEESRQQSFSELKFALLLSVVLVYMILASLFESFLHPFTIMLTLPLAGVGVVLAFWIVGEPMSIMAYIGVIMLAGIAVNDSIILVDYIGRLRLDGLPRREAILQAGKDRLRPILITSATTILALLPLTIGLGEGAKLRAPMAIAVIGGLVTSTILTLIVIPVVYELIDGLKRNPERSAVLEKE